MATDFQKRVKKALLEETAKEPAKTVYPNKVIAKKTGTIEARRGFFYTHGYTSTDWMNDVVAHLASLDIAVTVVESFENWQPWPRDSYWTVTLKPKE